VLELKVLRSAIRMTSGHVALSRFSPSQLHFTSSTTCVPLTHPYAKGLICGHLALAKNDSLTAGTNVLTRPPQNRLKLPSHPWAETTRQTPSSSLV
jgi:hypothetical protein